MARADAPEGDVEVWPKLINYARDHGLEIDTVYSKKVDWMEKHKGVCFCSWDSGRICPCDKIEEDLVQYNGSCFCGLLVTPERLRRAQAYDKQKKKKKFKPVILSNAGPDIQFHFQAKRLMSHGKILMTK